VNAAFFATAGTAPVSSGSSKLFAAPTRNASSDAGGYYSEGKKRAIKGIKNGSKINEKKFRFEPIPPEADFSHRQFPRCFSGSQRPPTLSPVILAPVLFFCLIAIIASYVTALTPQSTPVVYYSSRFGHSSFN
jgi:hypothetical protein